MAKRQEDSSEAEELRKSMEGVIPLAPDARGRIHSRPPIHKPLPASGSPIDEDSSDPAGDFAVSGVAPREIKRLKRGDYPAEDRLDLHGMTAADACASAGRFIDKNRLARHRCVCIVHGRGLHSEGEVSVVKARVRARLRSHRAVLAYTDAPRRDGGAGAVFVLLRK
jgi:DNA-nicking Smr family endonuclease